MELKLGIMTNKELAEWFEVSPKTFSNKRKFYLEKLKEFCQFSEGSKRGQYIIEEIYYPIYIKNLNGDEEVYLKLVKEADEHLTSISGMAEVLSCTEEYRQSSIGSIKYRMRKAGVAGFGITRDDSSYGKYGSRKYVWAIKLYDRDNHYRHLTEEEEKIFDELITAVYMSEPERVKKAALLEKTFKEDKDMTKEEYFEQKELLGLDVFYDVIRKFTDKTGLQIVHATEHDIIESAF